MEIQLEHFINTFGSVKKNPDPNSIDSLSGIFYLPYILPLR